MDFYFLTKGGKKLRKNKMSKRILSFSAALLLCFSPAGSASAETPDYNDHDAELLLESADISQIPADEDTEPLYVAKNTYSDYYDQYSGENRPDAEILTWCKDYVSAENGDFSVGNYGNDTETKSDVLIWDSNDGEVTYNVDIPESGIYCMNMSYYPIESTATTVEFGIEIDGSSPYDTASRVSLNKVWVNEKEITVDSRGNQIRPAQIQKGEWLTSDIKDVDGLFNDPLIFYLEKGSHTVTFTGTKANLALEYFKFYNPKELPGYDEYVQSAGVSRESGSAEGVIRIEGENAVKKSDSTLYPTNDNSNYMVSPSSPVNMLYNTIGSGTWSKALQTITFEVPADQIPADGGWYRMGIKSRQNEMRGFYSNRRIYVDGQVLCKELDQVKFYYDNDWSVVTPKSESGEDIYVYLTGGAAHTITMEVIPGEIGDSMRKLDNVVFELNNYYRQILMITGPNPDKYTDYYVHDKIPGLLDEFAKLSQDLKDVQQNIESLAGSEGSEASTLERMTVVLDQCIEKPLRIPDYLGQIKDNVTAISSWMRDYRNQPLEIDYIELAADNSNYSTTKKNFFKSVWYSIRAFLNSFFEDYTQLSDETGAEVINVWVNLGRDQAQVVKGLVESDFSQQYPDIPISVNLVVGGVVEATLADKGPDIALFLGGEFPVNLAARGLLVDCSQFSDYEEVKSRFHENATVNYEYDGGCYGIPVNQMWPMMFYRKDVLSELGFTAPPETWQDLIDMLPALQRNYMGVGLVLPPANISPATELGHTFAMLLLQKGVNYYNPEQTASNLDSIEAVQAFEEWTDFYTKYDFEQTYDAFNRFRTGEYPIVIQSYTFFNQLSVASPEIKGLWDFTSVPGTLQEDGTISHAANSNGTAAVIFNKVSDKDAAWEFVKWFTSTDVQVKYGTQIEGLLGTMGRFEAANTEALQQLSWSQSELAKLNAQREELEEIPVIPASYATTRNIMNAFRETVNNLENPRDTLMWYNRDINEEITRKRENLGLDN